jgi:hypothetical protein
MLLFPTLRYLVVCVETKHRCDRNPQPHPHVSPTHAIREWSQEKYLLKRQGLYFLDDVCNRNQDKYKKVNVEIYKFSMYLPMCHSERKAQRAQ